MQDKHFRGQDLVVWYVSNLLQLALPLSVPVLQQNVDRMVKLYPLHIRSPVMRSQARKLEKIAVSVICIQCGPGAGHLHTPGRPPTFDTHVFESAMDEFSGKDEAFVE